MLQEAESGRLATILGVQYGQAAGANKNYQQQLLNQKNANIQANQMMMSSMQSLSSIDFGDGGGTTSVDNSLDLNTSPNLGYEKGKMGGASGYGFGGKDGTGLTWNPITQKFE
jgi:hypothetical protein